MQFMETANSIEETSSIKATIGNIQNYVPVTASTQSESFLQGYVADETATIGGDLTGKILSWAYSSPMNSPGVQKIIKVVDGSTGKVVNLILSVTQEGKVKGTVSTFSGFGAEAATSFVLTGLVGTAGALSLPALCVGAIAGFVGYCFNNQVDNWFDYKDKLTKNADIIQQAGDQGGLKISSKTDNISDIKTYLTENGFLEASGTAQIVVVTPSGKQYEVIRGSEFNNIKNEISRRGYYDGISSLYYENQSVGWDPYPTVYPQFKSRLTQSPTSIQIHR